MGAPARANAVTDPRRDRHVSLTGNAFFYTLILATVVAIVLTTLAWGAVRGPKALRWLLRVGMIGVCQVTAIAVVAVWINNDNGLYTSWTDLLGDTSANNVTLPSSDTAWAKAVFGPGPSGFESAMYKGPVSGLTGQVLVWTPPQYDQTKYQNDRFPVIVLLHGYPGSTKTWLAGGKMPQSLAQMMAKGTMKPAVIVVPTIDPNGKNTDCTDSNGVRNGTWIGTDVPNMIKRQFRVLDSAHGWGLVGISTGGYCAVRMVLKHPDRFATAVAMSPDDFHGDPSNVSTKGVLASENPLALLRRTGPDTDVSIMVATSLHDRYSTKANADALRTAAKFPVQVATPLLLKDGGHNWGTWTSMYPSLFPWLNALLDAPQSETTPTTHAAKKH
ncbi:alpha/beta hydrolase [Streptacidiphilus rugosus]|uniref:alpha/beta hydrolase n=1 Tax=Streptacidiphilus rugosus TaxID=405783 RepID=UPI00068A0424|nr:alpha/beta hydrolase-fold protein [Streptacidiphilus rugosus]